MDLKPGTVARLHLKSTDETPIGIWTGTGWAWVPADGRRGLLGAVSVASASVAVTILKAGDPL